MPPTPRVQYQNWLLFERSSRKLSADDGFRYRNRFASGEMTSTSIFATALITREHALPGVVLLTKSLLGMPVSRFDDRGRRLRVSRPHLHLAALPPAADGIRYVDLVGLVVAAGGLALGLYRSFHHEIRVSVADLHQMLLSRFTSGELEYSRQVKPYESVIDLVLDMASRRGLDPAEWIQRVYEPVEELADPQPNHRPSSIGRGNVHPFWQRLLCCWQRSLPYPNRILNLGATQNSLPYVLTNPPPYIRASRYDAVYVVTENFERFLSRFHSLCAQHGQE
ncbi:potassium channel, sub T, member 2 [Cyanidiococcus yangmingshanensis]|uniref:Potassium channel, sub T, member 2 n=1 Tax=Cyanidiococcus yangmingshanensis TaxID=2690220 RepID=A0A7J7IJD1_9RHOD|nr:potassium channel, sub T, member 2 [Cyanidiococcus yangmingshanensis]